MNKGKVEYSACLVAADMYRGCRRGVGSENVMKGRGATPAASQVNVGRGNSRVVVVTSSCCQTTTELESLLCVAHGEYAQK